MGRRVDEIAQRAERCLCGYMGKSAAKGETMSDTKNLVKQQYGAHAEGYVTSKVHAQGESLKRLVELVQPQNDWRVLDVSTGGGHTALAFAPFVREMVASDLTPEMLAAAEKFILDKGVTNVTFKIADAENLPFADGE